MLDSTWSKCAAIGGAAVVGVGVGWYAKGLYDEKALQAAAAEAHALGAAEGASAVRGQQRAAYQQLNNQ